VNIPGVTSSSYITPATTTADSGSTFRAVVSNTAGTVTSASATLTVSSAPVAPTITTQPASQTVTAGQTAAFTVVATGTAPLSYQWSRSGATIAGATSSSYTTGATTSSDNGAQFTVVVGNTAGSVTSSGAALTVSAAPVAPTITTQPASQTVTAGQTATFTVVATGTAPLSYQWSRSGATIAGATSSSYTTGATTSSDNGAQFTVVISNTAGSVTSGAVTLTVNPAPVAPTITTQPTSQTVAAGQTATFTVVATGTAPLSYQWQKNGANISGATSKTYTTSATTTSDNGSTFDVVVSNSVASVTSATAALTVNPATVVPTIVTQPVSRTLTAGQTASFSVVATGTAPLSYQWQKNGAALAGATSSTYITPPEITADNGAQFAVVVTNSAGSATSNAATLTVNATTYLLNPSTTSLSFGNVNVGGSSSQNVTFTNSGNSNVAILSVSIAAPGYNVSGLATGQVIAPAQTATLSVTFTPSSSGSLPGTVLVASNATNSPATITLSGSGVTSTSSLPTCGKLNDTNVYTPPNYDTFVPPTKGQSYTDPVFGCKITRITDSTSALFGANHFYNTITPFNASDTYLMLSQSNGGGFGGPMVVDLSGNIVVSQSNMPGSNSAILLWDTTNPKVFYYTRGNQFIKGTISGTPPNATVTSTVLATFSQYASAVIPGDMDISNDGLHIWLTSAPDMGGYSYTADVFLVTLNAGNGNATSAAMGAVMPSVTYHKLQIVPQ